MSVSPALPAGKEFHYTLKAEFACDGKPVAVNKTVTVRAGEETSVDLTADLAHRTALVKLMALIGRP